MNRAEWIRNFGTLFSCLCLSWSNSVIFPPLSFSLLLRLMYDHWLGPGCVPSQLRGRKTEMEGGEPGSGGGGGGVRHEESSFCGKNLLSLHMAHREDDKYSCSDRTMKKMVDESCSTECVNESMNGWKNEGLDERVDEWIAEKNMRVSPDVSSQYSAACLTSVWYLYPLLSARFFFFLFPAERPWFLWA